MNTPRHSSLVQSNGTGCSFVFLCAQMAFAHPQKGEAVGFLTGFRHPISGLDHVLAMVAVGLWGAQLGAPAIWVLPVAFPMVMAVRRHAGTDGSAAAGDRVWNRSLGNPSGCCRNVRSAPAAGCCRGAGRLLCHLPRARARNRTAARPKCSALQHGLRHCDWVLARVGNWHRYGPSMDVGTEVAAGRRSIGRCRWDVLYVEGGRMKDATQSRLPLYAFVVFTFVMCALPAEAHLNSTGMGPFYDGSDALPDEPRGYRSGVRAGAAGWTARRELWAPGALRASRCVVARRSAGLTLTTAKPHPCYRGSLVSLLGRIAGRRRQALIARDHRSRRTAGPLSRLFEWNRHGAVRYCRGSASRIGVCRVCPDRARCGVRSSATRALDSNCRPRRGKLDRSQRSLDARLGSSNTLESRSSCACEKLSGPDIDPRMADKAAADTHLTGTGSPRDWAQGSLADFPLMCTRKADNACTNVSERRQNLDDLPIFQYSGSTKLSARSRPTAMSKIQGIVRRRMT